MGALLTAPSVFDRLSARVRDHDEIDFDRFTADFRGIGHYRY